MRDSWRLSYEEFLERVKTPWARRSFELANSPRYLDRITEVYPIKDNAERELDEETWARIEAAYKKGDEREVITALFEAPRFPFTDPYVGILRRYGTEHLDWNPDQVKRLAERVYEMSLAEIRQACARPKEAHRQMGPQFRNWIAKRYPLVDEEEFLAHDEGVCQLRGGDLTLEDFARRHLDYRETGATAKMGIDAILKVDSLYLPIEAKFFTDDGGGQRHQLNDSVDFLKRFPKKRRDIEPLAVVDGYYLILENGGEGKRSGKLAIKKPTQQIALNKKTMLSALLLGELVSDRCAAKAPAGR